MYGEKAYALVKELQDREHELLPYNSDLVAEVSNEIVQLIEQIRRDQNISTTEDSPSDNSLLLIPQIRIQNEVIKRNQRCLLAYHYNRLRLLRQMRWEFGSILPYEIKFNLSPAESSWFNKYSTILGNYMRSIGECGLNLALSLKPPKALYVPVRCLVDYGNLELSDGSFILLKKNKVHFLPRSECEELIRQGILEHLVD